LPYFYLYLLSSWDDRKAPLQPAPAGRFKVLEMRRNRALSRLRKSGEVRFLRQKEDSVLLTSQAWSPKSFH
jgi:hypothetical protein